MKNFIKLLSILTIVFFLYLDVNAWIDWLQNIKSIENISKNSIDINNTGNIQDDIKSLWFSILTIIKYIFSWIIIIFMVYAWIQMIISMWNNEENLEKSKKQLYYTIIWLIFINIPWTLYNAFNTNKWQIDWWINGTFSNPWVDENILINIDTFNQTLNWWIIKFIEISIASIAVFMIILAWIRMIWSRWNEEQIKESKEKIIWSIVWLIFVWFIEIWKKVIYSWKISDGINLFQTIQNIALFIAWPTAILFLTIAWYYYITSAWDEEKIKKAKNIIISVIIGTIILLASYTFLNDLITF